MKRSGPPKRKTELRQGSKGLKRSALGRGDKTLERKSQLRTFSPLSAAKPPKATPLEEAARAAFFAALRPVCESCGHRPYEWERKYELEVHHVVRQQVLRRMARDATLDPVLVVWDPRWAMTLCVEPAPERCHQRHTLRVRRVPGTLVPPQAWIAAEELDDALEAAGRPRTAILELRREHP